MMTVLRYRTFVSIWALGLSAFAGACGQDDPDDLTVRRTALIETPAFVQAGFATPQTPQVSVAVTFGGAQAAGNFIAVLVGWSDTTAQVTSVSDTSGNTYQVAAGPTTRPGELTHVIYYAKNIAAAAAGANVVQVAFSQAASYPDVRVLEYSGVDRAAPLDVAVGATGSSAASASGSVATTNANDLLIAGNVVMTYTSAAGSDFVARVVTTPDGSLAADRVVSATGLYGATASLTGAGAWIMQMAAFRAATINDDTQPPSAATALTATAASSSQINLAWTAATDDVGVTGYLIERCQGADCASFAQVGSASGATYSDAGLAAATSYSYRVRARDAAGNMGGYSNAAAAMTPTAPVAGPAYVQGSYAVPQTPQTTVAVTYEDTQGQGHLNVVVVGWSDSSAHVSSVSDSAGNVYALAVGPTVMSGTASQAIYYAKNIAAATAGANVVTVTFDQPANYADVRAVEYGGVDATAPLDAVASDQGTGTISSTPAVTTSNAVDLLVAANLVSTGTIGAGGDFELRLLTDPDGDIVEDRVVSAPGEYAATAPLTASGTWIMQISAFKAASQTPPPPPDQCHNAGPCDPSIGSCSYPAKPNGTTCNDGATCTQSETCQAGRCQASSQFPPILNLVVEHLGQLGGNYAIPSDINAGGQTVGGAVTVSGESHGFLKNPGGPMVDLGSQFGLPGPSSASAINDAGTVVGFMTASDGNHAYRYNPSGGLEDLGLVGDGTIFTEVFPEGFTFVQQGSYGGDVNAQGQVAGRFTDDYMLHGFRYTDGEFEDIGSLAGGATLAFAINASGVVGGSSWVPGTPQTNDVRRFGHAVIFENASVGPVDLNGLIDPMLGWNLNAAIDMAGDFVVGTGERNGTLRAFRLRLSTGVIDDISAGWEGASFGSGVNTHGDVVGYGHRDAAELELAGFVYSDRFGFKNLNDVIGPASEWNVRTTSAINDSGDIVGWGYFGGAVSAYRVRMPPGQAATCQARGVCGGGDGDAICLYSDGVAELPNGRLVAVFGFDNASSSSVQPTVNKVHLSGVFVPNPEPAPPAYLLPGTHTGAFLPTFAPNEYVSWTVNGETVTARPTDHRLQTVDLGGGRVGVVIGGKTIDLAASPQEAVTPRFDGICDMGSGQYLAVFGYDSLAPQNVRTPYGTDENVVAVDNVVTLDPSPAPPSWFLPGRHLGAFLPTFSSTQTVTWTVGGTTLAANATSTLLTCQPPVVGSNGLVATVQTPDGPTTVTIRRDVRAELESAIVGPDPINPGLTVGTLDGQLGVSNDGAATYHVPIWVPDAPLVPDLALDYNSRNDESFTGVGFRLTGFGEITRCRAAYAQDPPLRPASGINFSDTDHLCLDGRILIPTSGTPWTNGARYRPDNDPFTRVHQFVSGSLSFFEVSRRDGTIETYGQTTDSVAGVGSAGMPQFSWGLNRRRDRSANIVEYKYRVAAPPADDAIAERLPDAVKFGAQGALQPYTVAFSYESSLVNRGGYLSGYAHPSTQLLTKIIVSGPMLKMGGRLNDRVYKIAYDRPSISGRSSISTIQQCDGDTQLSTCMPPTTFTWEPGEMGFRHEPVALNAEIGPLVDGQQYYFLTTGDVNGDGLDDIIYRGIGLGGVVVYYRLSNGSGFDPGPPQMVPGSAVYQLADRPTYVRESLLFKDTLIADVDLDGAGDIKIRDGQFRSVTRGANVAAGDGAADFDGDGLPDYIDTDTFWPFITAGNTVSVPIRIVRNRTTTGDNPRLGFSDLFPAAAVAGLLDYSLSSTGVFPPLVDVDGNGSVDLVVSTPAQALVARALPSVLPSVPSSVGFLSTVLPPLGTDRDHGERPMIFVDVNGDGLSEALAFNDAHADHDNGPPKVYINKGFRGGVGGFSLATGGLPNAYFRQVTWLRRISNTECERYLPVGTSCDYEDGFILGADPGLRVADFNGDGRQDVISFAAPFHAPANDGIYDSSEGDDPSAHTRISYDPSWVQLFLGTNTGLGETVGPGIQAGGPTGRGIGPHVFNRVLDVNGDGLPDLISRQSITFNPENPVPSFSLYIHRGQKPDLLTSVTNGLGATDEIEYDHLGNKESGVYTRMPPGTCAYPQYCVTKGVWVVSKLRRDTGGAVDGRVFADTTFKYRDARTDVQGLGWIGFRSMETTDEVTGKITSTTYGDAFIRFTIMPERVSSYPEAFLPTQVIETWPLDATHGLQRSQDRVYTVGPAGEVLLASSVEKEQELTSSGYATKTRRTLLRPEPNAYDAYGNPLHETERIEQSDGPSASLHDVFLRTTDWTYDNDAQSWLLGLKRTDTTTLQTFGIDAETHVRRLGWDYKPGTNLIAHGVREPNGAADVALTNTFERNDRGLVTRVIRQDSSGQSRVTDIGYDSFVGHLPETITQAGLTITQRHHPTFGTLARAEDPNGAGASFVYDTFGRLKKVLPDRAGTTTLTYSPVFAGAGTFTIGETTGGAPTQSTTFDELGRARISLVHGLAPGVFSATFADYDAAGRIARVSRPTAPAPSSPADAWVYTNFTYDAASRPTTTIYPAEGLDGGIPKTPGQMIRTYDWLSATAFHLDKVGDATARLIRTTTVDARADVVSTASTDPDTGHVATTYFVYGAGGELKKVTDAAGNVTTMVHDAWDRRRTLIDPDTGTTQTAYNAFDDAVSDTTPRGTTVHTPDELGRLIRDNGPDGVTTMTWDLEPNGLGKPSLATSPDQVAIRWAYDAASRMRATTWTVPGEPAPLTLVQNRDPFGRLESVVYPQSGSYNLTAVYGYAPTGYLASITRHDGGPSAPLWTVNERNLDGQITAETFFGRLGDGTEVAQTQSLRSYTLTGKLLGQGTNSLPSSGSLHAAAYDYDGLGRVKTRAGDTFQYDFLNRLRVWNHASSAWTETYDYDDIGNLTRRTGAGPGGVELNEPFTFTGPGGGPHAVKTGPDGAYAYDELGNQKTAPGRTAQFWEFGLPREVTSSGTTTTFKYDALHARVLKSNNQGSSTISIGGLYEKRVTSSDTTYAYYVVGERGVVAQIEIDGLGNPHVKGLHDDHLGSAVLVTDENGEPSRIDFDPWGRKVTYDPNGHPIGVNMSVPGVRIGFTGHDEDDELGLVNMQGRLYDPKQRRFISPDPFVSDPFNGQSHNRYAYVLNNPLNLIDPSGFQATGGGTGGTGTGASGSPTPCACHVNPAYNTKGAMMKPGIPKGCTPTRSGGARGTPAPTPGRSSAAPEPGRVTQATDSETPGAKGQGGTGAKDGPGGPGSNSDSVGNNGGSPNGKQTLDVVPYNSGVDPKGSIGTIIQMVGENVFPDNPIEFMVAPLVPKVVSKGVKMVKGAYKAAKAARAAKALEKARKIRLPTIKSSPFGPKIADEIPKNGVPPNWSRSQIEDAIVDYETSIASRKAEQAAFNAVGRGSATEALAHAQRISSEEGFLRSLVKALGRSSND